MINGGYQIIDLENNNFTKDAKTKTYVGIYNKISGTRKAIVLSGLKADGAEYHDVFVAPTKNSTNYVINIYGFTFTIANTDVVTVTGFEGEI